MLKETVEVVFAKFAQCDGTDLNPHLQSIVSCSLLHHSSKDPIHQQGAANMSSFILSNPSLWKDSVDGYKKHLLAKCDEVVCVFDGATGIDKIFQMLFNVNTISLSKAVLPLQLNFCYSYTSSPAGIKEIPFEINSVDNLSALLHFYYGVHCISSGKNSEYFSEMNCEPFCSSTKPKFQEFFGEIPGDFTHYFYESVTDYKEEAYIYFAGYKNSRNFFFVLAQALFDSVSKFVKEHFDIDF